MKNIYGGNNLTKLCTKFGFNPKISNGSKIGGTPRDRATDGRTDRESKNIINSASRIYKKFSKFQKNLMMNKKNVNFVIKAPPHPWITPF